MSVHQYLKQSCEKIFFENWRQRHHHINHHILNFCKLLWAVCYQQYSLIYQCSESVSLALCIAHYTSSLNTAISLGYVKIILKNVYVGTQNSY